MTKMFAALALLAFLTVPALAQINRCAPRAEQVEKLGSKFHETLRHIALTAKGGALEVYVSDKGTWTVLVSSPAGVSCVMDVGKHFQSLPVPVPGSDS